MFKKVSLSPRSNPFFASFFARRVSARRRFISISLALILGFVLPTTGLFTLEVSADSTAQTLPFAQNWTNTGLITANDNWSGVAGIEGYLGQDITTGTGVDPQTLLGTSAIASDLDVIANQTNPNTLTNGGVAEFHSTLQAAPANTNPTIALNGSGTADAPYVLLYLNTAGKSNINVSYNVRDLDCSADNALQPVALQFRIGNSGNFTNVPAGFVPDATTGPSLCTAVTAVSVALPASANNQPLLQVRAITANAVGNDEWVGIDDILVTGDDVGDPTDPTGTGLATPNSVLPGETSKLTVTVTPGTNPASTGLAVTADLTSIGGLAAQTFSDTGSDGDVTPGDNVFTYDATVAIATTPGAKSLPFSITDAQARSGSGSISLTVQAPPPPSDHVVISQVYGGGGNASATYQNDYVELYNPSPTTFNLNGWSIQYASATGSGWSGGTVPIHGPIAPGEYYLIKLATNGAVGAVLPAANAEGIVNMSATNGKIALVNNTQGLSGAVATCPTEDPNLVDFVGYGTANCSEGAATAPQGSNTQAILRKANGAQDTNQNGADFAAGAPNPRRTAPIFDAPPFITSTDTDSEPGASTPAPKDGSVAVFFSEPVDLTGNWYSISCVNTGAHTAVVTGGPRNWVITPDVNFQNSEQCTIQIFAANVRDADLDDAQPDTDFMQSDYSDTFTVVAAAPAPYDFSVHLTMGNPSGAVNDTNQPNNYLLEKPEFSLSYNRDRGGPNWVSWHLSDDWTGSLTRVDTFRPDPQLPAEWNRVNQLDYTGSGFDRGHMVPSADRLANLPLNQSTFLMDNIIPQAPDNNQQTWNNMEQALRTLTPVNELYIVSGGAGVGGTGDNGFATTIAGGRITVPAHTWKVVLVIPKDSGDDISRVQCGSRTIAVIAPNENFTNPDWTAYITTVDAVEELTGYDFFSNLPDAIENCVEAGTNGTNPPGTEGQSVSTDEDTAKAITLTAAAPDANPLTYIIVDEPDHGDLSGTGENQTYTPDPNYFGPDSFTFKVTNGTSESNTSTVSITVNSVNDAPVAVGDSYATDVNTQLNVSWPGVLANDSDPVEQSGLTAVLVADVSNGELTLNTDGSFTYDPDAGFTGTDSFTYKANDGSDDSNIVTVSIDVSDDEAPVITSSVATTLINSTNSNLVNVGLSASATDNSGEPVTFQVTVYGDEDDQTPTINNVVHSPDAKDLALGTLRLRGERVEANNGRVYLIVVTATDTSGNVSRAYHSVVVPKNNKQANVDMAIAEGTAAKAFAEANGVPPAGYFVIGDGPIIGPKQ